MLMLIISGSNGTRGGKGEAVSSVCPQRRLARAQEYIPPTGNGLWTQREPPQSYVLITAPKRARLTPLHWP